MSHHDEAADPWAKAVQHLKKVDSQLGEIIRRVGPCLLTPSEDRLGSLVGSIVSQQISTAAADSINRRLHELAGRPYHPSRLLELGEDAIRTCGLSRSKARYVLNVARAVAEDTASLDRFDGGWDDDAIIASLTTIKGVGVWTAQMFLIFALNRPDVFPVGDLGVRVALRNRFELEAIPMPSDCLTMGERWQPYRSVASWYLWRSLELR